MRMYIVCKTTSNSVRIQDDKQINAPVVARVLSRGCTSHHAGFVRGRGRALPAQQVGPTVHRVADSEEDCFPLGTSIFKLVTRNVMSSFECSPLARP